MPRRRPKTAAGTRSETLDRVCTVADERALAAGMRFDPERAAFACGWIEEHCFLYEGDRAGEPMILLPTWRDFFERLHGWVRWSDEWEGWIRRFTHAAKWAAKKNGKSPSAAAHNLYLLCGDGEPGQKVYQAAKNGEQARIAQKHAVNMVRQSPALFEDCKINNSTLAITHLPTNSELTILTGDDSRGAKAKEGLNGSVTYDEMHVVSREVEERTSRAGISRREPIIASFSTAGDDPSSVGFERFQYGRQVNAGDRDDPHFLHVEYCAPDKVTDADIEKHLDEYAAAANPTWGDLVKPSELRADWRASKGIPYKVARFKQYRLNLWIGSSHQWLDTAGWERGGEDFTLADLAGLECYMGLDLSLKWDMTACVFTFPWPAAGPDCVRIWPMFWLPEETAKMRNHLFPFLSWGQSGALNLTAGATVSEDWVRGQIRETITRFNLKVLNLYFDPYKAEQTTQKLHEGEQLGPTRVNGCVQKRTEFRQGMMSFIEPAASFERRVASGSVRHPKNPVMTWQVGHCEAESDQNRNARPTKPEPHSGKSVDGVVSAVMTMAGLSAPKKTRVMSPRILTVQS